jgi:hypothetical protein
VQNGTTERFPPVLPFVLPVYSMKSWACPVGKTLKRRRRVYSRLTRARIREFPLFSCFTVLDRYQVFGNIAKIGKTQGKTLGPAAVVLFCPDRAADPLNHLKNNKKGGKYGR